MPCMFEIQWIETVFRLLQSELSSILKMRTWSAMVVNFSHVKCLDGVMIKNYEFLSIFEMFLDFVVFM